jgi:hypothetical protein
MSDERDSALRSFMYEVLQFIIHSSLIAHRSLLLLALIASYSYLRAMIGSTFAARRAGK